MDFPFPTEQVAPTFGGRAPIVMGIAWAGLGFTTLLVIPRIYLRFVRGNQIKEQDVSLGFALLSWVRIYWYILSKLIFAEIGHRQLELPRPVYLPSPVIMASEPTYLSLPMTISL